MPPQNYHGSRPDHDGTQFSGAEIIAQVVSANTTLIHLFFNRIVARFVAHGLRSSSIVAPDAAAKPCVVRLAFVRRRQLMLQFLRLFETRSHGPEEIDGG